ncbi:MAG: hypothetical protein BWX54_02049 [Verrucomicrobia bacterium ADurb.Bin018]|nr:MAG: hypothetical protein BWX54_02049 [Verrucomicrobia bacterium ADurb.Bin018]
MSDIKLTCPDCKQHIAAPEEMAGQSVNCPTCNKILQIPEGSTVIPISQNPMPPSDVAPSGSPQTTPATDAGVNDTRKKPQVATSLTEMAKTTNRPFSQPSRRASATPRPESRRAAPATPPRACIARRTAPLLRAGRALLRSPYRLPPESPQLLLPSSLPSASPRGTLPPIRCPRKPWDAGACRSLVARRFGDADSVFPMRREDGRRRCGSPPLPPPPARAHGALSGARGRIRALSRGLRRPLRADPRVLQTSGRKGRLQIPGLRHLRPRSREGALLRVRARRARRFLVQAALPLSLLPPEAGAALDGMGG